jgi:hypothetical protein
MVKLLAAVAGAALVAVAVAAGAWQLHRDAERADVPRQAPERVAKTLPAAPSAATKPKAARRPAAKSPSSACRSDELSDSASDNHDRALSGDGCRPSAADEQDRNGDDGSGPAEETGPDEAQGPDDSGNDP